MEILKKIFRKKEKPKKLWKGVDVDYYHVKAIHFIILLTLIIKNVIIFLLIICLKRHVLISSIGSTTKSEEIDDEVIYMEDLEKRKEVYGICGECNEPGTGWRWCQPCNAKRFKENFNNWTSGNEDIDELIQHSQLNAVYHNKCLEWIPFENFENVTYITKGGFGKIYSANWPEG